MVLVLTVSQYQYSRLKRCGFSPWEGMFPWRRKWHSSILAWKIPWTEEPGGLQSLGSQESNMAEHTRIQHFNASQHQNDYKENL